MLVNPPEQIFAEKLFSLAKVGPTSTRFKDVDDMYYLLANKLIDKKTIKQCLELLVINKAYGINEVQDVMDRAVNCLNNGLFISGYINSNGAWLKLDYEIVKNNLIDFIYKL